MRIQPSGLAPPPAIMPAALPANPQLQPWASRAPAAADAPAPRSFWLLAAGGIAATVADIQFSRACIDRFAACQEQSPVLPRSLAGAYLVEGAADLAVIGAAAWMRRQGSPRLARLPLAALIAAHAAGAVVAWRAARTLAARQ